MGNETQAERLEGQVAVVTGAAGGIGAAIAAELAADGAAVALLDRDEGVAREEAAAITARTDNRAVAFRCDVSRENEVERAFSRCSDQLGPPTVLVNAAGVSGPVRFVEMSVEEWETVFAVNARGAFLCARAAARLMLAGSGGVIINVSSQAAKRGQALVAHYSAAKAAVLGLTRALARELAPAIRVNAICPGVVDTAMVRASLEREAGILGCELADLERRVAAETPLGRMQSSTSIAAAVRYLVTAEDVTGLALDVDGGMVMG